MANDVKQTVLIPELDSAEGQFELLLKTRKHSWSRKIYSSAQGQFARAGMITHAMNIGGGDLGGDFSKDYAITEGTATQKRLDTQHAQTFTPAIVDSIIAEVKAFYAKKRALVTN